MGGTIEFLVKYGYIVVFVGVAHNRGRDCQCQRFEDIEPTEPRQCSGGR
jgi:hypothetical protein